MAKGADLLALKICDAAVDAKVPVLQAPALAHALYAHAELDREIPAALFAAVAQVLAYVYQLRAALRGHVAMPAALPELNVPEELDPHHKPVPRMEIFDWRTGRVPALARKVIGPISFSDRLAVSCSRS